MSDVTILTIGDYLGITDKTPAREFLSRYPDPVLVSVGEQPVGEGRADSGEATIPAEALGEGGLRRSFGAASRECMVYPVRKSGGTQHKDVTVGRTQNNDIWIDDKHVSKFHAVLRRDEKTGQWTIEEMGSTNGTFVDEKRLEARKPSPLPDGVAIHFGRFHKFYFHSAEAFHRYLDILKRFSL